ncbi:hypothetical protein VTO73DRAFT_12047 [Trametes versicolor]
MLILNVLHIIKNSVRQASFMGDIVDMYLPFFSDTSAPHNAYCLSPRPRSGSRTSNLVSRFLIDLRGSTYNRPDRPPRGTH